MIDLVIGWPEGLWLALAFMTLGLYLAKDGEVREEKYSFIGRLIGIILNGALLCWGGFFS